MDRDSPAARAVAHNCIPDDCGLAAARGSRRRSNQVMKVQWIAPDVIRRRIEFVNSCSAELNEGHVLDINVCRMRHEDMATRAERVGRPGDYVPAGVPDRNRAIWTAVPVGVE